MELYDAFDHAIASTAAIVTTVRPDQAAAPTPCTEWNIRDLLNHIIGTLWLSEALLSDRAPRHPMAPGGLPGTDLTGQDPAAAYAEASAAALTAAGAGDTLTRMHTTPLGDMPGPALAGHVAKWCGVHAGEGIARAGGGQRCGRCVGVGGCGIFAGQVGAGQAAGRHRIAGRAVGEQGLAEPQCADHVVEQVADVPLGTRGGRANLIGTYGLDDRSGRGDGMVERFVELHRESSPDRQVPGPGN